VALFLFIGFRYEVGGDWEGYINYLDYAVGHPFMAFIGEDDIGYDAINWFGGNVFGGILLVNCICAILIVRGIFVFAYSLDSPYLALLIASPYYIIVVSTGYVRQAVAIALIASAVRDLARRESLGVFVKIVMASLFHKSALIFLVFLFRFKAQTKKDRFFGVILIFCISIVIACVYSEIATKIFSYIGSGYSSRGAILRVSDYLIASVAYFLWLRLTIIDTGVSGFYNACAVAGLFLFSSLFIIESTTIIDRISLYLIIFEMFVVSALASRIPKKSIARVAYVFVVILFCYLKLYVWIEYSDNASGWIPYRNVIIEWFLYGS
jgi:hypothetical protein